MKYRLKTDPEITCEAQAIMGSVSVTDEQAREFTFTIPWRLFLKAWELIPEEKPVEIDDQLREVAEGALFSLGDARQLCRGAANEIERLKADNEKLSEMVNAAHGDCGDSQECRPSEADMMSGPPISVEEPCRPAKEYVMSKSAAIQKAKYDALWGRYLEMVACNAELGEALVEKLVTEKEHVDSTGEKP